MTYEEIINNAQYIAAMPDAVALLKRYHEGIENVLNDLLFNREGHEARTIQKAIEDLQQLLNEEPKP